MASKPISELSFSEAQSFFSEQTSYVNFDLPKYFTFEEILKLSSELLLESGGLKELCKTVIVKGSKDQHCNPKDYAKVNYILLGNKDGAYSCRPFELIHPVIYMDLVLMLTQKDNWNILLERLKEFNASCVECISMPRVSVDETSHKSELIRYWWAELEQASIKKGLDYNYLFSTDITNCYGSIYTHAIDWAITGDKEIARKNLKENKRTLGWMIDTAMRQMTNGQTNGIPQGSTLMDFISELVLGYADIELTKALEGKVNFDEFEILRFRDDYRIFVNNPIVGHEILKTLNEVLFGLGMRMNADKTLEHDDIISASIKKEKLELIMTPRMEQGWQEQAYRVHLISKKYPNSKIIEKELAKFFDNLEKAAVKDLGDIEVLISIFTKVALVSPSSISWIATIIAKLLETMDDEDKKELIFNKIHRKFEQMPNSSFIDVWLQRISTANHLEVDYEDKLTKAAESKILVSEIWNSEWLSESVNEKLDAIEISTLNVLIQKDELPRAIAAEEVRLFRSYYEF